MRKQRKILGILLGVIGGMTLLNVILFVVGVFSPLAFGLILSAELIGSALIVWRMVVLTNKLNKKLLEKTVQDLSVKKSEDDPTAIYKILGIPVQYDDTGKVLSIYELLGLTPMYDEKGNRIKTIYEKLEVNPSFTKDGVEKPTVVIIKNRIDKLAKVKSANKTTFVRKMTPEELERLKMIKMLREKKEEAAKQGDKEKVAKITTVINKLSPPKKSDGGGGKAKSSEIKPATAKVSKSAGYKAVPVKIPKSAWGKGVSKDKEKTPEKPASNTPPQTQQNTASRNIPDNMKHRQFNMSYENKDENSANAEMTN